MIIVNTLDSLVDQMFQDEVEAEIERFYQATKDEWIDLGEEPISNNVESPSHYRYGGIETIDFIKAKLEPKEFEGYCKGNIFKYLSRAGRKGTKIEDLRKAEVYLKWLIENCNK